MSAQIVTYEGRRVALCTPWDVVLSAELRQRDAGDPERRFVLVMCVYAGAIFGRHLPGPYTDSEARRFARATLLPAELVERDGSDDYNIAQVLGVPDAELRAARAERWTSSRVR